MKKAKLMALLLATAMCTSALWGCGSDETSSSGGSSQDTSGTASDTNSDTASEPENIVWYRFGFNASGDYSTAVKNVTDELNTYLKDKINVTVEMQCFSSKEYGTKLSLAMASKEPVDLFWAGSTYSMNTPKELVRDGSVYDLTELVMNSPDLYNYMSEDIWEISKYDGKIYFVPNFKDMGNGAGLMFSAKWVEEADFDISTVKKLSDLEPFLAAIKDAGCEAPYLGAGANSGPMGNFFIFVQNNPYIYSPFSAEVVAFDRNTNQVVNMAETDVYEETVYTLQDFNEKGYIPSWLATDTDSSKLNQCRQDNNYGVINAGVYPDYESFWLASYGHEGKYLQMSDILLDRDGTLGSSYAVPVYSTKAEAAVKFLTLLETDRTVGDLIFYGVKDKNYTVDADGFITQSPDSGYSFPLWATTTLLNVSLMAGQSENTYDAVKQFVEDEVTSPLFGFAFDPSAVEAEITAVKEVATGYSLFGTGDMDVATDLPAFREELREAGVDRIIEEAQRQVDEYLQSK